MSILEIVLLCALLTVVSFGLVKWLFQKDTEIENRRRGAAKLAGVLSALGLKRIPAILIDYSVGDYSGVAHRIKETVDLFLEGEGAVVNEFAKVFESVLAAKLKTESGRAYVAAKLADAALESDAKIIGDAPQPATK